MGFKESEGDTKRRDEKYSGQKYKQGGGLNQISHQFIEKIRHDKQTTHNKEENQHSLARMNNFFVIVNIICSGAFEDRRAHGKMGVVRFFLHKHSFVF